jgi:hypothetical protein
MKISYLIPALFASIVLNASGVEITKGVPFVKVDVNGKTYKIEREQRPNAYLTNTFALTSRPSPPFFIEPFHVSDKVETYGELEVLEFLEKKQGVFIDARLKNWYQKKCNSRCCQYPIQNFLNRFTEA